MRQLPADSWDWPTPSKFSVRELVQHVVVGNRFTALLLAGVDRDEARTLLAGDQVGKDPATAVADSARSQAHAFAATPPERSFPGPNGDVAAAYLRLRLVDLVVHAWDLMRAAGLDETLDPRIVASLVQPVEPIGIEREPGRVDSSGARPRYHRRPDSSLGKGLQGARLGRTASAAAGQSESNDFFNPSLFLYR